MPLLSFAPTYTLGCPLRIPDLGTSYDLSQCQPLGRLLLRTSPRSHGSKVLQEWLPPTPFSACSSPCSLSLLSLPVCSFLPLTCSLSFSPLTLSHALPYDWRALMHVLPTPLHDVLCGPHSNKCAKAVVPPRTVTCLVQQQHVSVPWSHRSHQLALLVRAPLTSNLDSPLRSA